MTSSLGAYEHALTNPAGWRLRTAGGTTVALDAGLHRWCGGADTDDEAVLDRCRGTVLDVGCGPGRLVGALADRGRPALGVDIAATAVRMARATGATVIHTSVFDPLPGEGRWDTVLLADGNIGIGGHPANLLRRCAQLMHPAGQILVELDAPGTGTSRVRLRLESTHHVGHWFHWAHVAADDVQQPAAHAGLTVQDLWQQGRRWFATLTR